MNAPQAPNDRQRLLDQQVLAVLRSGGGWNARTRARLASLAKRAGVDVQVVVASAIRAASMGGVAPAGVREQPGFVQSPAPGAAAPGVHASAASSAMSAAGAASSRSARSAPNRAFEILIGMALLLMALAVSVGLTLFAIDRADRTASQATSGSGAESALAAPDASRAGRAEAEPRAAPSAPRSTDARTAATNPAPSARDTPPVPAIYARPPVLRTAGSPAWARNALESVAAGEQELLGMQARLVAGGASSDADRADWQRVAEAFCGSWPLLDARRRDALIDAIAAVHPRLGSAEQRTGLRGPLEEAQRSQAAGPEALWRGSGAAGLLAALDRRSAGDAPLAFAEAALEWLAPRTADVADATLAGDPAAAADAVDAWLQATEGATSSGTLRDDRDARVASLLDILLRRNAPMGRPGTAADAAGTLLDSLGWTADAARRSKLAGTFRAWFEDPAVTAAALHGLTSVLAARRPGTWWEPWMVSDARADMASRTRTAEHFDAALAATAGEASAVAESPRIRGVRPELVERWVRISQLALGRTPADDPAFRIAHAAEMVAMVECARLLERGRTSDAEARISQVEDPQGIAPDALDRWKGRTERTVGRAPAGDGKLDQELRARASADDRGAALRSLRTRAIGDLGPADAATIAREALTGPSPQLRSVAQGVIADVFAAGPNVVSALAAEVPAAVDVGEAASLAGMVSGQAVPRGPDDRRRAAAMLLLLDHHASLVPSDRHRLDSVAQEFTYSANSATRALAGRPEPADAAPEVALRAWFDARVAESRPVIRPEAMQQLLRRAEERRRLAAPGPQATAAELVGLLEIDAAVIDERLPRRRAAVERIKVQCASERSAAPDVYAQIDCTSRALLELAVLGIAPEGGAQ